MIILGITIGLRLWVWVRLWFFQLFATKLNLFNVSADTLKRRAEDAIKNRQEHVNAFKEFDAALPPSTTKEWTKQVQAWERDSTQPNPFEPPKKGAVVLFS